MVAVSFDRYAGIVVALNAEGGYGKVAYRDDRGTRHIIDFQLSDFRRTREPIKVGQYVVVEFSPFGLYNRRTNQYHPARPGISIRQGKVGKSTPIDPEARRAKWFARKYSVSGYSQANGTLLVLLGAPADISSGALGPPLIEESIDVNVYLDTNDDSQAEAVLNAVDAIASLLGYDGPHDETIERGSIIRRAKAKLRPNLSPQEALALRAKLEQAAELIAIGERQAKVNQISASAISTVLASLNEIPAACVHVGTILIIKYTNDQGPVVLIRPLSALELKLLERLPGILQNPRNAIETLAAAVISVEAAEQE